MKKDARTVLNTDVVVIGAGFAGLYMLHRLRQLGLASQVFESGKDVGGTWYWNRYPGARCDVESMQYSYSFSDELQQEWQWTERYPQQQEILSYINHVADRFDLRRDIRFETRVTGARYDEHLQQWKVTTDQGDEVTARFVISAAGCLSAGRVPDVPGLDDFRGRWFHTGQWPHEKVYFSGLRVGIVGTGSSGIQAIPVIAREAAELVVFQRTAGFSIPAWNRPLEDNQQAAWKAEYASHRDKARQTRSGILYDYGQRAATEVDEAERRAEYERRWLRGGANFVHAFNDLFTNRQSNDTAADFVRAKIRQAVKDPVVAKKLTPDDHAIGTKRICVDSGYYETFNLPHVRLVDLRAEPIKAITESGIQTTAADYGLDCIVFATGYDAVTGSLDRIDIRGKGGVALKESWSQGPRSYLGLMSVGFPNLLFITGPGSPSITTNVIVAIEQHVDWITNCLQHMQDNKLATTEAQATAQDEWVAHVKEVADRTLFPGTKSWFMGANIPGKPNVFLPYVGGLGNYTVICEKVAAEGYRGFEFNKGHSDA